MLLGSYQKGVGGYKHVYFNLTSNTLWIWISTVALVLVIYECVRYLINLHFSRALRLSMFVLIISVLYTHYYTWWMYFNYLDDFYTQWNHQAFFTITELLSTGMVLYLCNRRHEVSPRALLVIISVAVLHIVAAGVDQFVLHVLFGEGAYYQNIRDIGLMIPDLLNLVIPLYVWRKWCKANGIAYMQSVTTKEIGTSCVSVFVLLVLWHHL